MVDSPEMVSTLPILDLKYRDICQKHTFSLPSGLGIIPTIYCLNRVWLWSQEVNNPQWLELTMYSVLTVRDAPLP